jgi:Putative zinc-finger
MTTTQLNETTANDHHAELEGMVPWYVKGTLTTTENALMKQHLKECEICRSEVSNCEFLADHLPSATESWKPSPSHFAGILAEVDKLEAATVKREIPRPVNDAGFFRRIRTYLSQTPSPVRWTLALETLAFAALALFVVLPLHPNSGAGGGVFEILSNAETPTTTQDLSIRLMFTEDMTTRELFELLKQAKAQIRQGPSVVGSYTVEVSTEAAAQSLATLRAHPKVRLAQPVEKRSSNP